MLNISISDIVTFAAIGLVLASLGYLALAIERVIRLRSRLAQPVTGNFTPPLTVMKPLCGIEPELADNLRSFCRQDYGTFQIVCGVRDPNDEAIAVVEGIKREFPDHDITLVVDERAVGSNLKVCNLANMADAARHDILVISDSDMRVGPDYLKSVAAPFASPKVGAATCIYSASARAANGGLASRLGAMFINDWFLPSALIAIAFGRLSFCFGATMAVRRRVVEKFGGFAALAHHIADDYLLGRKVTEEGHKIAFVPYVVENITFEQDLKGLFAHELRWARTIRAVQPLGYTLSFITEAVPLALLAAIPVYVATASAAMAMAPLACALALRLALHYAVSAAVGPKGSLTPRLIPLRDLFSAAVRIASFFGTRVIWRGQEMTATPVKAAVSGEIRPQTFGKAYEKDPVSQPADL